MSASSHQAELSSVRSQLEELRARVEKIALTYQGTPDSAVAAELFEADRALTTAGRTIDRALDRPVGSGPLPVAGPSEGRRSARPQGSGPGAHGGGASKQRAAPAFRRRPPCLSGRRIPEVGLYGASRGPAPYLEERPPAGLRSR